jgi:hypothetical protein
VFHKKARGGAAIVIDNKRKTKAEGYAYIKRKINNTTSKSKQRLLNNNRCICPRGGQTRRERKIL